MWGSDFIFVCFGNLLFYCCLALRLQCPHKLDIAKVDYQTIGLSAEVIPSGFLYAAVGRAR